MNPLRGRLLLEAWERASAGGDAGRAAALLAASCPGTSEGQWAELGIAELNLELARLWHASFGAALRGCLPCPECGVRLEFDMSVPELVRHLEGKLGEETAEWAVGGDRFILRRANTLDLAAAAAAGAGEARLLLLGRCVQVNGVTASGGEAREALRSSEDLAAANFERLHGAAEVVCQVRCADCGHSEGVDLDLARFVWAAVRHRAISLMRDVHELACATGWSEDAILGMSESRRQGYLELIRT
jgi:hypothetical protein